MWFQPELNELRIQDPRWEVLRKRRTTNRQNYSEIDRNHRADAATKTNRTRGRPGQSHRWWPIRCPFLSTTGPAGDDEFRWDSRNVLGTCPSSLRYFFGCRGFHAETIRVQAAPGDDGCEAVLPRHSRQVALLRRAEVDEAFSSQAPRHNLL